MLYLPYETRELSEKEREMVYKKFKQESNLVSFEGNIAYKGKVKGKVKLITSKADLLKVGKDDVLVSQFTRPEYLPAMQKAIAFITND